MGAQELMLLIEALKAYSAGSLLVHLTKKGIFWQELLRAWCPAIAIAE